MSSLELGEPTSSGVGSPRKVSRVLGLKLLEILLATLVLKVVKEGTRNWLSSDKLSRGSDLGGRSLRARSSRVDNCLGGALIQVDESAVGKNGIAFSGKQVS